MLEDTSSIIVINRQVRSITQDYERLVIMSEEVRDREGKVRDAAEECLVEMLRGLDAGFDGYEKAQ